MLGLRCSLLRWHVDRFFRSLNDSWIYCCCSFFFLRCIFCIVLLDFFAVKVFFLFYNTDVHILALASLRGESIHL